MPANSIKAFRSTVLAHFEAYGRHDMPWRLPEPDGSFDPYKILVSEIMLQQTQVARVIPKYYEFLSQFPTVETLAEAPLSRVLITWNGLGYNRRAKFLWQAARQITDHHHGVFPEDFARLVALPGIGKNTAGALQAYAFNLPVAFVETNIRTVFIYHFFQGKVDVPDAEILAMVQKTLPKDARQWYWALMDYGTFLKQTIGNLNKLSKVYAKQSRFQGSRRQLRGQVIRLLSAGPQRLEKLAQVISDERLRSVLQDLQREALIQKTDHKYTLR